LLYHLNKDIRSSIYHFYAKKLPNFGESPFPYTGFGFIFLVSSI